MYASKSSLKTSKSVCDCDESCSYSNTNYSPKPPSSLSLLYNYSLSVSHSEPIEFNNSKLSCSLESSLSSSFNSSSPSSPNEPTNFFNSNRETDSLITTTSYSDESSISQQLERESELKSLSILNKLKKKKINRKKCVDLSKELAFKVRRNAETSTFYFLNNTSEIESIERESSNDRLDLIHNQYPLSNSVHVCLNSIDRDSYTPASKRPKRANKRVALKTLVRKNDLIPLMSTSTAAGAGYGQTNNNRNPLKLVSITAKSFNKNSSKLYVKYNIYKKLAATTEFFDSYVSFADRCQYKYASKQVDERHKLTPEFIAEIVRFHKSLTKLNTLMMNHQQQQQQSLHGENFDPPVVINYSLDHNRLNPELNQTYDDLYLEFLISIQHREITPEDYEYLSRLDELLKKKTVAASILDNLKTQQLDEHTLGQMSAECCGICLDGYLVEQVVKHLPCGHIFHLECIDEWLRTQSANCPLDKRAVDSNGIDEEAVVLEQSGDVQVDEQEITDDCVIVIAELLTNIVNQIESDNQVKDLLSDMIGSI